MAGAFSTLGTPIGMSPWQQQMPQQLLQLVPQQLQQLHYLQVQQLQVLQQLQQLLQIVPQQLHQLQHVLQFVPQQIQQLQQQLQNQQTPFGQTSGIGGGFGTSILGTPLFGPQSFPSHVM
jgi:hypothetical protein